MNSTMPVSRPSLSPRVCSNSCPLSYWCHPTILPHSVTLFSSCTQSFSASVFSNELALCIKWPKYWSFSFNISPPSEYSELVSMRINWFGLLALQGTLTSLLQHHSLKASVLWHSAFLMVQLSPVYDYWKNHSFDYMHLCEQSDVSALSYAV